MKSLRLYCFCVIYGLLVLLPVMVCAQKDSVYRFDFGSGVTAPGYLHVDALTNYTTEAGYGFDLGTKCIAVDRSGSNKGAHSEMAALETDFCRVAGSMFFSVKLPEGIYRVTATLGDLNGASKTTIKAESRRLMVKKLITRKGEFQKVRFLVRIWDSVISPGKFIDLKSREKGKLDYDNKLTLEFSNTRPCLAALEIEPVQPEKAITVFLSGNSTVTNQQLEPWASWGQMIPAMFNEKVVVANMAASGETLRSTVSRRRLDKIAAMIRPGDYLFIEFAHNDQKSGSGEKAFGSYNEYLKRFIDTAKRHGAIPVLVTSTRRRAFNAKGELENTLGDFPAAMRLEAKKEHVALLDLNELTKKLYLAYGEEGSKALFVQFPKGSFPGQRETLADNTHFSDFGAFEIARCIASAIQKSTLNLKTNILPEWSAFDPEAPDQLIDWQLPYTPMFTHVKPAGN